MREHVLASRSSSELKAHAQIYYSFYNTINLHYTVLYRCILLADIHKYSVPMYIHYYKCMTLLAALIIIELFNAIIIIKTIF